VNRTIVADTGAIIALVDRRDRHHPALRRLFERDPGAWLLPWAILPEVDYLLATQLGARASETFLADCAEGRFAVEWGSQRDLRRASEINSRYRSLKLGLVDASVLAVAERLKAEAVATLDHRHFDAVELAHRPRLLPRDA
jgi:predicted nucleic acid-binding protein